MIPTQDNDSDRKIEIEENSPFQEGIISEIYERPDNSYVQEPQELTDLIDTTKLIQKNLPKQTDIDKILDIIKRKVLKEHTCPLQSKRSKPVTPLVLTLKIWTCFCPRISYPAKDPL